MNPTDTPLGALLDEGLVFAPEYGLALADHLPMALQALHALGAPAERLQVFRARHTGRLSRRPAAAAAADAQDWLRLRGQIESFEALHAMFAAQLQRQGRDAVLHAAVPALVDGASGAAFHGLIRTAHAVAAGHAGELAMGLAYWAARHQRLHHDDTALPGDLGFDVWLERVAGAPALAPGISGDMISPRMRAWSHEPHFVTVAPRLHLADDTLDQLAQAAAARYAQGADFTVLHMVTACQAMRTLSPWWGDAAHALRHFSVAAAAALCASRPPRTAFAATPLPWPGIIERAIASDDEHVVKLVLACRQHEAATGAPVFQAAASRAVQ